MEFNILEFTAVPIGTILGIRIDECQIIDFKNERLTGDHVCEFVRLISYDKETGKPEYVFDLRPIFSFYQNAFPILNKRLANRLKEEFECGRIEYIEHWGCCSGNDVVEGFEFELNNEKHKVSWRISEHLYNRDIGLFLCMN